MTLHELAEEGFARAVGVQVGDVYEIVSRLAKGVVNFPCLVLRGAPASVIAEGHGAERRFGNSKPAIFQKSVFHLDLSFSATPASGPSISSLWGSSGSDCKRRRIDGSPQPALGRDESPKPISLSRFRPPWPR